MPLIERASFVLVVVDAQDGFYGSSRSDVDRARMRAALDVAAWVAGLATALRVPVVVTEEDAVTNGPTDPVVARAVGAAARFDKTVFGAADNPAIAAAVRMTRATTVVLVGMETDVCIAHSALGWQAEGLRAVVVHDAVFSAGPGHDNGIRRLAREGIELVSAKELYYDWLRSLAAVRRFDAENPLLAQPPGFSL